MNNFDFLAPIVEAYGRAMPSLYVPVSLMLAVAWPTEWLYRLWLPLLGLSWVPQPIILPAEVYKVTKGPHHRRRPGMLACVYISGAYTGSRPVCLMIVVAIMLMPAAPHPSPGRRAQGWHARHCAFPFPSSLFVRWRLVACRWA